MSEWYNITVGGDGGGQGIADHYASLEALQAVADAVAGNSRDMDVAWLVLCGEKC